MGHLSGIDVTSLNKTKKIVFAVPKINLDLIHVYKQKYIDEKKNA